MHLSYSVRAALVFGLVWIAALSPRTQAQGEDQTVAADAEALARNGQTVEAEALVQSYLRRHPEAVAVNVVGGELQAFRHEWASAMQYFESALRVSPTDLPAQKGEREAATALALHLRAAQDADGALATLEHAHAVLPSDVATALNLALQAQAMHRWKTAGDAVNRALALAPANDRVLYAAAGIAFDRGNSGAAAQYYRDYLKQHPEDASAHYGLGRALRVQQKPAEAQAALQRSIALQPLQTEAYYQLGEIALEGGQDEDARWNYQKTLSRMPTHGGALTGMGMLAYRAHDYTAAKASLEQAVSAAPDYQPAHYYLGLTLRRLGNTAGAERELHTATELAATQQGKAAPVSAQ